MQIVDRERLIVRSERADGAARRRPAVGRSEWTRGGVSRFELELEQE